MRGYPPKEVIMKELLRLLQEMADIYDAYHGGTELVSNQGQPLDGYSALANYDDVARQIKKELERL